MVLGPQGPGRVGRRQAQEPLLIYINSGFSLRFYKECLYENGV